VIYRKLFHLLSLFLIIPVIIFDENQRIIFSILFLLVVFTIDTLRQKDKNFRKLFMSFFKGILKKYEFKEYTGATYLAFAYAIINILFEKEIVIFSILVIAFCDTSAYLFGTYIKPNIKLYKKSINGLFGFIIAGFIISLLSFKELSLYSKLLAVFISAIVELIVPIDDNLSVPITSSVILKITA